MAVVINFKRPAFGAGDMIALRDALARFQFPGGWCGWNGDVSSNGECDLIDIINPNDWEPLTLTRTRQGDYCATDADGFVIGESKSFDTLLSDLDFLPC
ncbi:MAG: hypothetical protein PF501_12040 [Salinisphaera sp.]|jgi:hypothetical protein|nr:hypothetical protein [Salinisphaera sp.]